ncbi:hypothetical protein TVAG_539120, partial [Trichomonas vaginalis G3]
ADDLKKKVDDLEEKAKDADDLKKKVDDLEDKLKELADKKKSSSSSSSSDKGEDKGDEEEVISPAAQAALKALENEDTPALAELAKRVDDLEKKLADTPVAESAAEDAPVVCSGKDEDEAKADPAEVAELKKKVDDLEEKAKDADDLKKKVDDLEEKAKDADDLKKKVDDLEDKLKELADKKKSSSSSSSSDKGEDKGDEEEVISPAAQAALKALENEDTPALAELAKRVDDLEKKLADTPVDEDEANDVPVVCATRDIDPTDALNDVNDLNKRVDDLEEKAKNDEDQIDELKKKL